MAEEIQVAADVSPPGEAIHLPGPSFLPVIVAAGTTIALVGIVLNWVVFGLGALVALGAIVRWSRQTRRDIAELPLDHGH